MQVTVGKVFTSPPTDKKGGYAITDLPYGYYDLAVDREDGLYLANRVINLAPASTAEVLMTIVPFQPSQAQGRRDHLRHRRRRPARHRARLRFGRGRGDRGRPGLTRVTARCGLTSAVAASDNGAACPFERTKRGDPP